MKAALHLLRGPATMAALSVFGWALSRQPGELRWLFLALVVVGFSGFGWWLGRYRQYRHKADWWLGRPVRLKPTVLQALGKLLREVQAEAPSKPLLRDLSIDCEILHAPEPEARITLRNDGERVLRDIDITPANVLAFVSPGLLDRFARQNYLDGKSQVAMIEPGIFVRRLEPGRSAVFLRPLGPGQEPTSAVIELRATIDTDKQKTSYNAEVVPR
jgi:hypothetical protein